MNEKFRTQFVMKTNLQIVVVVRVDMEYRNIVYAALLNNITCFDLVEKISAFINYSKNQSYSSGKYMDVYNVISGFFNYDRFYNVYNDNKKYNCVELIDNSKIDPCYTLSNIFYQINHIVSGVVFIDINAYSSVPCPMYISAFSIQDDIRRAIVDKSFKIRRTRENKKAYKAFIDNRKNIDDNSMVNPNFSTNMIDLLGRTFYRADLYEAFSQKGCHFPNIYGCVVKKSFYNDHKELFSNHCSVIQDEEYEDNVRIVYDSDNDDLDKDRIELYSDSIVKKLFKELNGEF